MSASGSGGVSVARCGGSPLIGSKRKALSAEPRGRSVKSPPHISIARSATSICSGAIISGELDCSINSRSNSCVTVVGAFWAACMRTGFAAQSTFSASLCMAYASCHTFGETLR